MANVLVEENSLSSIANAIRTKNGLATTYKPAQMPQAILDISTGIDTSDATAYATDLMSGKTAYARGSKITGTYTWDTDSNYDTCDDIADDILGNAITYDQLDYIQFTGDQILDTGLTLTDKSKFEASFSISGGNVFGCNDDSNAWQLAPFNGNQELYVQSITYPSNWINFNPTTYPNITIGYHGGNMYIYNDNNGNLISQKSLTLTKHYVGKTLYIGNINTATSPTVGSFSGKLKRFRVWNGDTLISEIVPAKFSNNVVGAYDKVRNIRLTDIIGTTPFTPGSVVNNS